MTKTSTWRRNAGVLLILGSASGTALAEIIDIGWDANGRFERTTTVAPGKFAEVCGPLRKGKAIEWAFDADAALDFNIHYHQGKKVVFPAKQDAVVKRNGKLAVKRDQDYCWMWTNKSSSDVALRLTLKQ
ncbi:hypothetical protein HLB44_29820 [Aquincola sp. S2]|uniref:Uncharacterized protein n=1 Tax=Pseudaquabacterium terrae TaxID=2732868 RepID=A0ABX2ERW4_9BURK|nr:hypothetical protein [Aquabacterium terrae]NRF71199.1 hypothetical protein [Aquabacterium terrae]